jgi:acyl carrier protein
MKGFLMSDISDRVKKIVVEHLNVEEEFSIEIPDDAAENIQTFGDAVKFINDNS